ncbi:50S ribosomal protein L22, apicoplast, putative [Plasmodium gallinaceum]|uniref:50S ribosomal protein L22, apicoplast, putative n=1 Tax=Plasmodium gallinaceum TaxID=5849 RepID=A0A1J1GQT3_PLAGA|nr:50S ribosomal protein L22, apicoplast, putative [Plasmodium gallinaceum]CRG94871.1 50S ribosomal protein L22, apicoplast, putative [Plasmodium gallinaceum]
MFILQVILDHSIYVYNFTINNKKKITYLKYGNQIMNRGGIIPFKDPKKKYYNVSFLLRTTSEIQEENKLSETFCKMENINEKESSLFDEMDLFHNEGIQLKQWYSAQKVKEAWKEKHIENIKSNYKKVLLNNKYNELFNMYRNVNNNNVENYKKRVKTNRINPVIYVKKRLVSATAKYIKMSFIKTRKILWKIRYMPIIKAFAFLYYYGTNKYTVNIYKCIKSCLHNAINKYGKNNIKPVFHTLQANMGGYTKKINIRAKGKTDIIREPHTHIRVVLEV